MNGDVRLAGGTGTDQGRLEFCLSNMWYSVCNNSFDSIDGSVICRQLGFSRYREYPFSTFTVIVHVVC